MAHLNPTITTTDSSQRESNTQLYHSHGTTSIGALIPTLRGHLPREYSAQSVPNNPHNSLTYSSKTTRS